MKVLKKFAYYPDGVTRHIAAPGDAVPADLPADLVAGLVAEGFIDTPEMERVTPAAETNPAAPAETAAATGAPETKALPDDWRSLNAEGMKDLAARLTGDVYLTKADALDAIESYVEAQEAAAS